MYEYDSNPIVDVDHLTTHYQVNFRFIDKLFQTIDIWRKIKIMTDSQAQKIKKDDVTKFLKSNFVASLSTMGNIKPTSSPIVYVIDNRLNFYFVTNTNTYKAKNILNNPNVSMSVWQFSQMSIQMDGIATEITDDATKEWVIEEFGEAATKDPNFWAPIFRIKRSDYVVFKVEPTWLRALDLSHNTVRSKQSPYTSIIE